VGSRFSVVSFRLNVFTTGAVVAPGQTVLEIVPDHAPLIMRAQISPADADDLHVGQTAEVRITALHERDIPILNGKVTFLSADSFSDERTGMPYSRRTFWLDQRN
jgi:HlyD family secretion protein